MSWTLRVTNRPESLAEAVTSKGGGVIEKDLGRQSRIEATPLGVKVIINTEVRQITVPLEDGGSLVAGDSLRIQGRKGREAAIFWRREEL